MPGNPLEASNETLMVRYQRGERAAFAELARRHAQRVYNFLLGQLHDPAQASPATRATFAELARRAAEFKPEASFRRFLYGIARGFCAESPAGTPDSVPLSAASEHLPLSVRDLSGHQSLEIQLSDKKSAAEAEMSPELREAVTLAVQQLPPEQREVFLLREVADLSFADIAELTSAEEITVQNRMRRALERLKKAVSGFEEYSRSLR